MPTPILRSRRAQELQVRGPFVGVNTQNESRLLASNEAEDALNLVLDDATLKVRNGYDAGAIAPNGLAVEGQHDYRQNDGTRHHLVKAGDQLYRLAGTTYTAIGGSVLTSGTIAQFVTVSNRAYIAHGGSPKVTDGTSLFDWEITKPSAAPAIGSGIGVLLSGSYDYKVTFYSSTWGQESPSSAKTLYKTVDSGSIALSNLPTTTDARVDKLRIYRRKISALEADWFFVDEIDDTVTTWHDNTLDNDVSTTRVAPLTFDQSFPSVKYLAENGGTMFGAGVASEPNRLYYTGVNNTTFENFLLVDDDGEEITGLVSFQTNLVIFTRRSIWVLSGNSPSTFFLRKVVPDRGCCAPHSIVPVDAQIYFLSETGFFAYDLSNVVEISRRIQPTLLLRAFSRDAMIVGVHDRPNNSVWWSYSGSGSSTNDKMLVYYYRNSRVTKGDSWVPWEFSNLCHMGQVTNPDTNLREIRLGFTDGRVSTYSGTSDNGSDIPWRWTTGKQDLATPQVRKFFGRLVIELVRQTGGTMDAEVSVDSDADFSFVGRQHRQTDEFFRTRIRRRARQLRVRLSGDTSSGGELIGWTLEAEASARS